MGKNVTDFPLEPTKNKVVEAFRKNQMQATVSDLVGLTGLPKIQVEQVLPAVVHERRGHMQVTESGEILYQFPQGLTNQVSGSGAVWKRRMRKVLAIAGQVARGLFKAWIMLMLVGYFALFVFILIAAVVISIALQFAKRDEERSEGGGFLGFYLATRVFEFFLLLWLYSGDPDNRVRKVRKPFHKAIFEFVFGVEERPEVWETAVRKAAIATIRRNKGTVTVDELMLLTGRSRTECDALVSQLMVDYEGEPQVSDRGSLYFSFPELMRTSNQPGEAGPEGNRPELPEQPLTPFSHNPASTNRWITFINAFNVVLGGYFLAFGLQGFENVQAVGDPLSIVYQLTVLISGSESLVIWGLGVVPVVYSGLFFGIPLLRRAREQARNALKKVNNFRKKVLQKIWSNPLAINLASIEPDSERTAAGRPGVEREALKEAILRDFAGPRPIEVQGEGVLTYQIPEVLHERDDLAEVRKKVDTTKYQIGKVVFDTQKRVGDD